jgi:serine/threonine protein kinase
VANKEIDLFVPFYFSHFFDPKKQTKIPHAPNLVGCLAAEFGVEDYKETAYILMELATEGSVFDLMEKMEKDGSRRFTEDQIIGIFRDVCTGTRALHLNEPPIAHRDIKIENV